MHTKRKDNLARDFLGFFAYFNLSLLMVFGASFSAFAARCPPMVGKVAPKKPAQNPKVYKNVTKKLHTGA